MSTTNENKKGFFERMWDSNDPSVSSRTFIMVFTGIAITLGGIGLCFYCAWKHIGLPGGSTELLVILFGLAVLGKGLNDLVSLIQAVRGNPITSSTNTTTSSSSSVTTQKATTEEGS
jgi:hypothetical protein